MKSEHIDQLILALSKAQGEMKHASKESTNPYFKSKYADLPSIIDACKIALSKHELAIIQTIDNTNELSLITWLGHSSGQWMTSKMPILAKDNTPQALGSAITYARRYSLAALVGIAQEDDDAEAAMNRNGQKKASFYEEKRCVEDLRKELETRKIAPHFLDHYLDKRSQEGKVPKDQIIKNILHPSLFEKFLDKYQKEMEIFESQEAA